MEKSKALHLERIPKKSLELLAGTNGIEVTAVALMVSSGATLNDLKIVGERLGLRVRSYQWWIGDWFHQGEERFGEKFHQVSDATKLSYDYLNKMKSVAAKIAPENRRPDLPFSFHIIVAPLPSEEQITFLDQAVEHSLSRRELAAGMAAYPPLMRRLYRRLLAGHHHEVGGAKPFCP